jgi:hypothetical protein
MVYSTMRITLLAVALIAAGIVALAEGEAAGEAGAPKNDETQAVIVETLAVQPQLLG